MRERLRLWIYYVRTNFWFVPTLMSLAAIGAAFFFTRLDFALNQSPYLDDQLATRMSLESARAVLSTIAGSMITVATLVFSMTLVALTTVTQQLGPRILLRFMDDRPIQVVLGTFIGAFLFPLVLLMRVGEDAQAGDVPGVAVTVAVGLAVIALGAMISIFDHVSRRIQADSLIEELGIDLRRAAAGMTHAEDGAQPGEPEAAEISDVAGLMVRFDSGAPTCVTLENAGYLRSLNGAEAAQQASDAGLILRLCLRPGAFAFKGQTVIEAVREAGNTSAIDTEKLARLVAVGGKRTPEASVEFEITALVEVALRALSPGINDPYTAIACIDRLADGIMVLAAREPSHRVIRDTDGQIRLLLPPEPLKRYLSVAFDPIIHAGREIPLVQARLNDVFDVMAELTVYEPHCDAIREMKAML